MNEDKGINLNSVSGFCCLYNEHESSPDIIIWSGEATFEHNDEVN
jgi:hypothetical protein